MQDPEPARIQITSPADAAQLFPYLVGFTPEESLVVSAHRNGRVEVTGRVDLADVTPTGAVEQLLDRIWSRFPGADGYAIAYTTDHLAGWDLLQRCDAWLPFGCKTMVIDGDTWHTPDGTTGTIDPHGEISAQATRLGLRQLDHRTDLANRFTSPPDTQDLDRQLGIALTHLPAPGEKTRIIDLTRALLHRNLPDRDQSPGGRTGSLPHPAVSQTDAIQLAVLAQHPAARELALLSIEPDNAEQHLALWQAVIQASPACGADMPLYLAGMAAWISGDGASATIALEHLTRTQPPPGNDHPARLLDGLIDQVVPPTAWTSLRTTLLAEADPTVRAALTTSQLSATHRRWPPISSPESVMRTDREVGTPPSPGIAI